MTSEQFCYWLQGYTEVSGMVPDYERWKIIQEHLQTVFLKLTPSHTLPKTIGPIMDQLARPNDTWVYVSDKSWEPKAVC